MAAALAGIGVQPRTPRSATQVVIRPRYWLVLGPLYDNRPAQLTAKLPHRPAINRARHQRGAQPAVAWQRELDYSGEKMPPNPLRCHRLQIKINEVPPAARPDLGKVAFTAAVGFGAARRLRQPWLR